MILPQENSFFTEGLLPTQHDAVALRWIAVRLLPSVAAGRSVPFERVEQSARSGSPFKAWVMWCYHEGLEAREID
jgi:hypothetical protein